MKAELLDIEAALSCADASLQYTPPDVAGARKFIDEARELLLALATVAEETEKVKPATN